jgi:hypothetical protein
MSVRRPGEWSGIVSCARTEKAAVGGFGLSCRRKKIHLIRDSGLRTQELMHFLHHGHFDGPLELLYAFRINPGYSDCQTPSEVRLGRRIELYLKVG